jgi:hypothetical protein
MIPGWLDAIEAEVTACLESHGSLSARQLADSLGVSETCALGYITLLAGAGRVRIEAVSLPGEGGAHPGEDRMLSGSVNQRRRLPFPPPVGLS